MGRKRIEIKPIEDRQRRAVTFTKRRKGLFNKALQLAVIWGPRFRIALIIMSPGGTPYTFSHPPGCLNDLLHRYYEQMEDDEDGEGCEDGEVVDNARSGGAGEKVDNVVGAVKKADGVVRDRGKADGGDGEESNGMDLDLRLGGHPPPQVDEVEERELRLVMEGLDELRARVMQRLRELETRGGAGPSGTK